MVTGVLALGSAVASAITHRIFDERLHRYATTVGLPSSYLETASYFDLASGATRVLAIFLAVVTVALLIALLLVWRAEVRKRYGRTPG